MGFRPSVRDVKARGVGKGQTPERGATITDLVSEFLARKSGSAEAGSSVVVVPTPADPAGIRTCARDLRTWSAAKKHTEEERGGRRDPGVRRPGAGRGQLPARSKIFRAAICLVGLRVEFLLKTESGYLRDAGVTWFTLANP